MRPTRYGKDSHAVIEGNDGTHLWVRMDGVVWKSGQRTGDDGLTPALVLSIIRLFRMSSADRGYSLH